MEENLLYRINELFSKVEELTAKIDKINDTILQFKLADSTIGFKIESLEKDVAGIKEELHEQKKSIQELKEAPLKKDSQNWKQITNTILKYVIDAAILLMLAKIGLK